MKIPTLIAVLTAAVFPALPTLALAQAATPPPADAATQPAGQPRPTDQPTDQPATQPAPDDAAGPLRVEVVTVTEAPVVMDFVLTGAIEARDSLDVSFRMGGRVTEGMSAGRPR